LNRLGTNPLSKHGIFGPGENFVLRVQEATAQTDFTLAVLSEAYLQAAVHSAGVGRGICSGPERQEAQS